MIYVADDGSMGSAFNLVLVDRESLTTDQWLEVEEAGDNERVMKVIELLWGTGRNVWMPNIEDRDVKEIAL
jgi:hypothetical protein